MNLKVGKFFVLTRYVFFIIYDKFRYAWWSILWEARVRAPIRGAQRNANSTISFFWTADVTLQERMTLDRKLHLAITSDRVVTETSNLDLLGKKTWGIYWYGPLQSSAPPPIPPFFNSAICNFNNVSPCWFVLLLEPLGKEL